MNGHSRRQSGCHQRLNQVAGDLKLKLVSMYKNIIIENYYLEFLVLVKGKTKFVFDFRPASR